MHGIEVLGAGTPEFDQILTHDALEFLTKLQREFSRKRSELLERRITRQAEIDNGTLPDFLPETARIRNDATWKVAPIPDDLQKRHVEITGPVDRKMMINALNSGAEIFMADFEDANSPTWHNVLQGQINLRDAIDGSISFTNPDGKRYLLNEETATLLVRPRGWHLNEKHVFVDGKPISGSLFDFGLTFFHNAKRLIENGSGPYFYLPKLESHLEARLWNDVFNMAQDEIGIPRGSIKVTVLIETILAAFEMDEILYELREHIAGLNAGRWDYIFSVIKKFRNHPEFLLPDRGEITMTVPFMRAYTELLVKTCHNRGAHAIGGMAAFIPSRKDPHINEVALAKVREDKIREAGDGFDGTWVAHPDLVAIARAPFTKILGQRAHQKERLREDVHMTAGDLLHVTVEGGQITEDGVRKNINVALLYLESWLRGIGAAGIYNLMEDAATAEISRSQLWQWLNHEEAILSNGGKITPDLFQQFLPQELDKIKNLVGETPFSNGKFDTAARLLEKLVMGEKFKEFLTLEAYEYLT